MSESVQRVSPSSLAVYATCPRQYQYNKLWDVSSPESSRRYLDRGIAYHGAIEDVCREVATASDSFTDAEIQALASEAIDSRWSAETDRSEYVSDAQYAYDRQLATSAVESYFAGEGLDHARNSLDQELWLQCNYEGVHLHGRADNLVRTEEGLQVIDYKGSFGGIVSGGSHGKIETHHEGEEYAADLLKSVFQAAMYIEGIKEGPHYEPGMDVEFTFYALLASKERTRHVDGIRVSAAGRGRDVGWIYETHRDTVWQLIREAYDGILEARYEPEPWAPIREHACGDCDYQVMCGEYIGEEVRVGD